MEYYSKHNQVYWNNYEYIGVGLGAEGYLNNIRYRNTRSISSYNLGETIIYQEKINESDKMIYEIMLRLRTKDGINKNLFLERYGSLYLNKLCESIKKFVKLKLLIEDDDYIYCSDEGLMVLDYILRELFNLLEE